MLFIMYMNNMKMSFNAWTTLLFIMTYIMKYSFFYMSLVKSFMMMGMHACMSLLNDMHQRTYMMMYKKFMKNNMYSLCSKRYFNVKPKYNDKLNMNFNKWLVGFTDGDGTFNIYFNPTINNVDGGDQKGNITFTFKLSQSIYNEQMLHLIKRNLGVGTMSNDKSMSNYKVRRTNHLRDVMLPMFDEHMLLSSKYYNYTKFRESLLMYTDENMSKEDKLYLMSNIKEKPMPYNYQSPIWNDLNYLNMKSVNDINKMMSKEWLMGFIEAKGSFYLVKKGENRIVHAFGMSQKLDPIIIYSLKYKTHLSSSIRFREKHNFYIIESTNNRSIKFIINYFTSNNNSMLFYGAKNLEFSMWKRSYIKYKGNYDKLYEMQEQIMKLKIKHKMLEHK
ncbi:putative intron-encoded endonuclease (mitochondrion) [[Candida] railenensis]|uniref:putative intron-encoded endonuclease n=1 Tax=[Candida] railenensis TaxID=45579 RepID=UPI002027EF40|nr:putative intron-encoded endonuclease [[Candida] railenensis]CAH2356100.1 putative intron-encoded endonuclease [[Candida] railenensis]